MLLGRTSVAAGTTILNHLGHSVHNEVVVLTLKVGPMATVTSARVIGRPNQKESLLVCTTPLLSLLLTTLRRCEQGLRGRPDGE
ncbi:MAG: hypothetical protein NVSMB42_22770 [Herpetosiphon sp.]